MLKQQLSKQLEEKWGVTAAAGVTAGGAATAGREIKFSVLASAGDKKINVIKSRACGLGLKEARFSRSC